MARIAWPHCTVWPCTCTSLCASVVMLCAGVLQLYVVVGYWWRRLLPPGSPGSYDSSVNSLLSIHGGGSGWDLPRHV